MGEHRDTERAERLRSFAAAAGAVAALGSLAATAVLCLVWNSHPEWDSAMRRAVAWLAGVFCLGLAVRFYGIGALRSLNVDEPRLEILRALCRVLLWVSGAVGVLMAICLYMTGPQYRMDPEDAVWARGIAAGCAVLFGLCLPAFLYARSQLRIIDRLPQFTARYPELPLPPLAAKLRVPLPRLRTTVQDLITTGRLHGCRYDAERQMIVRKDTDS